MTECESCAPDRLAVAVRKVRESADPSRVDTEAATAVLEALLMELPEHFGPDAHSAYTFWLHNRIAALRLRKPFHRWVMTSSYLHYPELLMCEPPR